MDIKTAIPIGIESYKKIISGSYYYVDKTLLIRELLEYRSAVTLFTRPRRFGKTLTQSMLRTFFEEEIDADGNTVDNSAYFTGKKILDAGAQYTGHMGKYPVVSLSMKSAKQPDFEMACDSLLDEIIREFDRHRYLLRSGRIAEDIKERYSAILAGKAGRAAYAKSLAFLSDCLEKYHRRKTIILIDEYDVPLENAYFKGFYSQMVDFMRSLLESALKTNDSLQFAVITGCLRISRESIFTGLNNLKINSVLDESYSEYFGFMQDEVDSLLSFYGISQKEDEVKEWYDGYLFGHTEVYNPWSILNYVEDILSHNTEFPKPYWSNTSSNSIIHELVVRAGSCTVQEIEHLLMGEAIEKPVHEDITYGDIHQSEDNLWNFLFFTGYLKTVRKRFEGRTIFIKMKIPNEEVMYIYENTIQEWFQQKTRAADFSGLYHAILSGDTESAENFLKKQLRESISFMDSAEKFYHGFLLGLLGGLQDYRKKSNLESGNGRYDITLIPYDEQQPAVILELKRAKKFTDMENLCLEALRQIEEKKYADALIEEGYPIILKYGICFCKKSCMVKLSGKTAGYQTCRATEKRDC
ncbi:AAA family ATPase [bacterium D16-59]|nr:AAA family ATPase [bacterium D16-59]